jgi:hypothetical protein
VVKGNNTSWERGNESMMEGSTFDATGFGRHIRQQHVKTLPERHNLHLSHILQSYCNARLQLSFSAIFRGCVALYGWVMVRTVSSGSWKISETTVVTLPRRAISSSQGFKSTPNTKPLLPTFDMCYVYIEICGKRNCANPGLCLLLTPGKGNCKR